MYFCILFTGQESGKSAVKSCGVWHMGAFAVSLRSKWSIKRQQCNCHLDRNIQLRPSGGEVKPEAKTSNTRGANGCDAGVSFNFNPSFDYKWTVLLFVQLQINHALTQSLCTVADKKKVIIAQKICFDPRGNTNYVITPKWKGEKKAERNQSGIKGDKLV